MRIWLVLSAVLVVSSLCAAGDWPQFMGPDRNGVSPEKGLATSWPEGGPKELWSVKLGQGYGGAAVKDGKVYLPDRDGDGQGAKDILRCLDLAGGKELWSYQTDAPGKVNYRGPRATPAVDDEQVYSMGPMGTLYCISLKTHKLVWQKDVMKEYGSRMPEWQVAPSPLLYKNWVIIAPQSRKAGLAALDRKTGKQAWASEGFGGMGYASPILTTIDKVEQFVMVAVNSAAGVDPKNGKVLWKYDQWQCRFPIASAVPLGDGKLMITSIASGPYNSDTHIFRPKLEGGKWTVTKELRTTDFQSHMPTPIVYNKHVYANSSPSGKGLVCMDLEGNIKWSKSGLNDSGGELVIADGMIYMINGGNGMLYLVKATPEEYKELAKAQVLEGGQVWAPLTIADGKLLCRDQKQMKCFDISGK